MEVCTVSLTDYQLSVLRLSLLLACDEIKKDMSDFDILPSDKEEYKKTYRAMNQLSEKLRKSERKLEKWG